MSYRIPKTPKLGKEIFLAFKNEGRIKVNFDIRVYSNTCPEQVVSADTTCQTNYISFNGAKVLDNVDRLVLMTKHNLYCDGPVGVKLRKPKIYIKGCYWP